MCFNKMKFLSNIVVNISVLDNKATLFKNRQFIIYCILSWPGLRRLILPGRKNYKIFCQDRMKILDRSMSQQKSAREHIIRLFYKVNYKLDRKYILSSLVIACTVLYLTWFTVNWSIVNWSNQWKLTTLNKIAGNTRNQRCPHNL